MLIQDPNSASDSPTTPHRNSYGYTQMKLETAALAIGSMAYTAAIVSLLALSVITPAGAIIAGMIGLTAIGLKSYSICQKRNIVITTNMFTNDPAAYKKIKSLLKNQQQLQIIPDTGLISDTELTSEHSRIVESETRFIEIPDTWDIFSIFDKSLQPELTPENTAFLNPGHHTFRGGDCVKGTRTLEESFYRRCLFHDGAVYSKREKRIDISDNIEVTTGTLFRSHETEGLTILPEKKCKNITFITTAAIRRRDDNEIIATFQEYNRNHPQHEIPGISLDDPIQIDYQTYMKRQIRKIFRAAKQKGNTNIVLAGGLGCGSYGWSGQNFKEWTENILQEKEFKDIYVFNCKIPRSETRDWAGDTPGMQPGRIENGKRGECFQENMRIRAQLINHN